jgi:hypothetical protein
MLNETLSYNLNGMVSNGVLEGGGALGAWLEWFGAYEIERRPRGASRRKAAPTFVSGQLFL